MSTNLGLGSCAQTFLTTEVSFRSDFGTTTYRELDLSPPSCSVAASSVSEASPPRIRPEYGSCTASQYPNRRQRGTPNTST